jgi:hypothetical protein
VEYWYVEAGPLRPMLEHGEECAPYPEWAGGVTTQWVCRVGDLDVEVMELDVLW